MRDGRRVFSLGFLWALGLALIMAALLVWVWGASFPLSWG